MSFLPEEVCSNTDQVDLPSWCVDVPTLTAEFFAQCFAECCLLFLMMWLFDYIVRRKARNTLLKEMQIKQEEEEWKPPKTIQ